MYYFSIYSPYIIGSLIISFLFAVSAEAVRRFSKRTSSVFRIVIFILLGMYLSFIFAHAAFQVYSSNGTVNLVPFKILQNFSAELLRILDNIVIFFPLGLFLVLLSNKCQKLWVVSLTGILISFIVELIQLFIIKSVDIDDIILNLLGTALGFAAGKTVINIFPSLKRFIGIFIIQNNKLHRKKNDKADINILVIIVLVTVLFAGNFQLNVLNDNNNKIDTKADKNPPSEPKSVDKSENLKVTTQAQNAILYDVTDDKVLYEKSGNDNIAPASTTKMLTAITALDYCDLNEIVTIGNEIQKISPNSSKAWLSYGCELTIEDLLIAMLLPSGNDAAYSLAVFAGRKISDNENLSIENALEVFVEAMNDKAKSLGAKNSNFVTPDGYDNPNQYTTANDLSIIAHEFINSQELCRISGSRSIYSKWSSGQEITYYNTNELLNPDGEFFYKNVTGLKTGTSEDAGYCLVSSAKIDNKTYICVVMNSTQSGRWTDTISLLDAIK